MYTTLRMGMRPCEVIPKHDITRWVYKGAGGGGGGRPRRYTRGSQTLHEC
jgi:hypothetical protein